MIKDTIIYTLIGAITFSLFAGSVYLTVEYWPHSFFVSALTFSLYMMGREVAELFGFIKNKKS